MNNGRYLRRRLWNGFFLTLSVGATVFGLGWLTLILGTLLYKGFSGIDLRLFTEMTPPPGEDGGLLNPIVGSLLMNAFAVAVGTPIGILAGTYLAEYGRHARLSSVVRFVNDILLIPVVVRTTENMLLLIPNTLREAAIALGAPRSHVIRQVTWRAARAGIVTGVLLAIARISGETAPLLFTALNNQFWSLDPNAPMASLPVVIFQFAISPYNDWQTLAWSGALLITLAVLILSITARVLEARTDRR